MPTVHILPDPPSKWAVFKTVLSKHVYVARKRKRLLTSVWPALVYGILAVVFFHIFADLPADMGAIFMAIFIPLYMGFAVQSALTCAIIEVVNEKESKMKVTQEIYGLTPLMYWVSWAGYFGIVSLVCMVLLYCLFTLAAPMVSNSNPLFVLFVMALSYMQQLEFAAIIAVFFNRTQAASSAASFCGLILLLAAVGLQGLLRGAPKILWYLAGLLPSVNVFNGFAGLFWNEALYYCDAEGCTKGLTMRSLFATELCPAATFPDPCPAPMEIFSAGESMMLMLVDVVLYGVVAWWLEQVWQGEYGQAKPCFFCFDPAFMCPSRRRAGLLQEDGLESGREELAMSIKDMRKVFKGGKVAVDGMDLDIRRGEIFALLGHNGAGKTTCMNCVVGLIPMTSGSASVNGYDVHTCIEDVRRQLSICPQDNPLYDVYTVRQHLQFFAGLRGISSQLQGAKVMEVLVALGIPEKVDELCTSLSGGQKRRLWVATALLGETPLVFLDEPTSGMDPSSRRQLWQLLLKMRSTGRSIIFTTHYLEEADVLADRKAVLARGRVQASGTSRDLKLQFGLGYNLQIAFLPGAPTAEEMEVLGSLIRKHVATATLRSPERSDEEQSPVGSEGHISFTLPFQEVSKFGEMLLELEDQKEALRLGNYSISMTTLEEVFMALGEQAEREAAGSSPGDRARENVDFREIEADTEAGSLRVETSETRSAKAMMRLRLRLATANRSAVNSVLILPTIFNICAFVMRGSSSGGKPSTLGNSWMLAVYPPMGFGFSIVVFTLQLVREKEHKCKYVALAQGLSVRSYWIGTFVAHYLINVSNAIILLVVIQWKAEGPIKGSGFPLIVAEALVYPIQLLLLAYNLTLLFVRVELAVKVLPLSNMLLGTIPTSAVYMLQFVQEPWPTVAKNLHIVMSFTNPVYGLPGTIIMMSLDGEMSVLDHFTSSAAIPLYGSLAVIAFFASNLVFQDLRSYTARPGQIQAYDERRKDDDVLAEEQRVEYNYHSLEDAAKYQSLHHVYRTKVKKKWVETHAVRGISLGIRHGECFGLLGPNGAGKTTTLAVLTGEVRPPTAGQVQILGNDVTTAHGLEEAYQVLGVCPQIDPLWEFLTGREHLLFFGRVKGVPEAELNARVNNLLYRLGLDGQDADRKAVEYSGGMKRKLSLAIALIGRSPLLFLDEPSAAVDAGAKRHLWKVIRMRSRDQTVVLTTHSMEEAEALCNRIAIQVRGQLRCLGTPLHIKGKYGSGYQLELFCDPPADEFSHDFWAAKAEELMRFVRRHLSPKGSLLEHHAGRFLFQLPPLTEAAFSTKPEMRLTLGNIFIEVQKNMAELGLSDYSITQPSLEQVFVRFAREQDEDLEEAIPEAENEDAQG